MEPVRPPWAASPMKPTRLRSDGPRIGAGAVSNPYTLRPMSDAPLLETRLHDVHVAAGARMTAMDDDAENVRIRECAKGCVAYGSRDARIPRSLQKKHI